MVQELHDIKSIFDFLYLDNTKIKSFYAQLTGVGALTNIKENDELSTIQNKDAGIGVPPVASAKIAHQESVKRAGERLYDAIPTMPREMINKLDELGFIERELSEKTAGRLVLLQGKLTITDMGTLNGSMESLANIHIFQSTQGLNVEERDKASAEMRYFYQVMIDAMKTMPYALEATLFVNNSSVWMTLNRDEMVGNPHDINLKHGNILFGDYYVLGVLDAIPNDEENLPIAITNEFRNGIRDVVNELRTLIGRNPESYGITPIAIFRVIRSNKQ